MKKILIIEDDENIIHLEKDYLEANKFECELSFDGDDGLQKALENDFDLVILDIMLPKTDGLTVCKKIREQKDIPIILVSAKKEELDKIKGLGFGADDYVVKPFSPSELVARVIAHINRYERLTAKAPTEEKSEITVKEIKINTKSRKVFVGSTEVTFTNKEFDLLLYLAKNPDTVYSKDELVREIWNYDPMGETSTITVHINRVRDKLKESGAKEEYVHTVWGRGYRFN